MDKPETTATRAELLQKIEATIVSHVSAAIVLTIAVLGAAYYWLPMWFDFPTDSIDRLVFALQVASVPMAVLLLAILLVSTGRRRSVADAYGSAYGPPSPVLAIKAAFLQNTLEQTLLAVGALLILATYLSGPSLAVLPAGAALFVVGRITFYIGYTQSPMRRAFGMGLTMMPTVIAYGAIAWLLLGQILSFR